MIREQITRLFHAFVAIPPMAVMCGITDALAAFYDSLDVNNPRHREIAAYRLLSKMPTMAAMCYKYSIDPAVCLSAQRPLLRRQLPAHDVCDTVRK